MFKKIYSICLICLLLITFSAVPIYAENGVVSFSVKAIIPSNQINKNLTYFDLKMQPDEKQNLTVTIFNNTNEEIKIGMELTSASTNGNGLIDYTSNSTPDETLKTPLTQVASLPENTITVSANDSKNVIIQLDMPDTSFVGVILGGIILKEIDNDNSSNFEGLTLKNEYSYIIGVKLTENEQDVAPELALKSVKPSLINYRTAVVADIQNTQPTIIKGMQVTGEIYKNNETTIFKSSSNNIVDMAPNSTYAFPIDWKNQKLDPGDYRLHLTAVDGENKWEWDEVFTINKSSANQTNAESPYLPKTLPVILYIILGIAIAAAVLTAGVLIGRRAHK